MTDTAAPAAKPKWVLLFGVALAIVLADQVTKVIALGELTTAYADAKAETVGQKLDVFLSNDSHLGQATGPHTFIAAFWSHRYAENRGALFSFARDWPSNVRVPFFYLASIVAVVLIANYFRKLTPGQKLLMAALPCVLGGAVGNLVDRIARGYVIDFVDWHLADPDWHTRWHWATFNVADVGISVGVSLIVLDGILGWWRQRGAQAAEAKP